MYNLNIPYLKRKWDKFEDDMKGTSFFKDIKNEVLDLYSKGNNLHKISKILNIKYGSLYNHKKEIMNNENK